MRGSSILLHRETLDGSLKDLPDIALYQPRLQYYSYIVAATGKDTAVLP